MGWSKQFPDTIHAKQWILCYLQICPLSDIFGIGRRTGNRQMSDTSHWKCPFVLKPWVSHNNLKNYSLLVSQYLNSLSLSLSFSLSLSPRWVNQGVCWVRAPIQKNWSMGKWLGRKGTLIPLTLNCPSSQAPSCWQLTEDWSHVLNVLS